MGPWSRLAHSASQSSSTATIATPSRPPSGRAPRVTLSCTALPPHEESPSVRSFLLVVAIAAVLRCVVASRQGLWADELFSLAVATGHSLEHPASQAEPAAGDFVEPAGAVTPATFRRYLSPESPLVVVSHVI